MLSLDWQAKPMGGEALVQSLQRLGLEGIGGQANRTILIVDDDPDVLELHTRIVRERLPDCDVLTAENGRQALAVMRTVRPALVLLDLIMPELDGAGVLDAMHADRRTQDIPVIILTAQSLTEEDMDRLNHSVAAVLEKGVFTAEETLAHIEQTLARNKRLGSEAQRLVRKAMAYIHEHYAGTISREDIAAYAAVSPRHLTRCFTQEIGV